MADLIDRQAAIDIVRFECGEWKGLSKTIENMLNRLSSAQPYTDEELQTIQDLEQAQFDKMYELGKQDAQPEQSIAQERYEDLCEYFKDCSDQGRSTLNDRKEFKSWLDRMKWHVMECDKLGRELEKLKSTQPEPQWIPCSERLPEEYGEYRITWITSASGKRLIGDAEFEVTSVWDNEHDRFKGEWLLDDYIKNYPDVKVLAWKPLEEPWRGEEL